jgi:hypothetical protein
MPKQMDLESLLKDQLGKEVADAMLSKVDEMVKTGKSADAIEKALTGDLLTHVEKQVTLAVIAKIGPITPIKVKPISVDIKTSIKPISVSSSVKNSIQIKVPNVKIGPMEVKPPLGLTKKGGK